MHFFIIKKKFDSKKNDDDAKFIDSNSFRTVLDLIVKFDLYIGVCGWLSLIRK